MGNEINEKQMIRGLQLSNLDLWLGTVGAPNAGAGLAHIFGVRVRQRPGRA
jgi:hypothetical protein